MGDDAAVYRVRDDLALVQSVDFFPPVVDDPFAFGAIAAANAVSDIYAMGGHPLVALNIACFPAGLDKSILVRILQGAEHIAGEAPFTIVGGHTIDDDEPKFGMAVTGLVEPGKFVTNHNARPGDDLVLTKPLGSGLITTAVKQDRALLGQEAAAIALMMALNRDPADAMVEVGVHACTDITGFGLLGHLRSICVNSSVGARLRLSAIPLLDGVWELAARGTVPGGTGRNLEYLEPYVEWAPSLPQDVRAVLADPQTSGGLLIAVPRERTQQLLEALRLRRTPCAAVIGSVTGGTPGQILVEP